MRNLRGAVAFLFVAQLLADAPLASALWEMPALNIFSPQEPFEFSSLVYFCWLRRCINHSVSRFLQGTWTAEVRVHDNIEGGNGFMVTTMPVQGKVIGRYYENVTESTEVKSQLLFQVALVLNAGCSPILPVLISVL
jgi:hypothetical protein